MMYRPIMNPIEPFDARRRPQPHPGLQPEMQPQGSGRDKVMEAMISPQQFSFAAGRNFSDMYQAPKPQPMQQQPQMGRILRPRGVK